MRSRAYGIVLLLSYLAGCATLPTDYELTHSHAFLGTEDTTLGIEVSEWVEGHDGKSGFYPLPDGLDALGARLALIDRAERSIDAQYFLAKPDDAGLLFAFSLIEAANRGVRVRILLDDVFTTVKDQGLFALDGYSNIEVRLFNPIARGGIMWANFLADFKRANRRMHNKSFTVDNQVTVVGGRNIAEEYFQLKSDSEFIDFDVLGFGPVAAGVSETFDRFWNHHLAIPISAFDVELQPEELTRAAAERAQTLKASIYHQAIDAPLVRDLLTDRATLYPATTDVITDDPEKLLNRVSEEHQVLVTRMAEVVDEAESEVILISPYFIPGDSGVEFWTAIVKKGVRVVVFTNSLASTNHPYVHAAYARYRKKLIAAGVELYEARANASKSRSAYGDELEALTLHTKLIMIDRRYTFVGSLNLDPRSIDINTEMGLLVDSAEMTGPLAGRFYRKLPNYSYRLVLNERGKLRWRAKINGEDVAETKEPLTSGWKRFANFFARIIPESQL